MHGSKTYKGGMYKIHKNSKFINHNKFHTMVENVDIYPFSNRVLFQDRLKMLMQSSN